MDVRDAAEQVRDRLLDSLGDDLLAVGWYSSQAEGRTGTVYAVPTFGEHQGSGKGALENAMLESMGNAALEGIHDESPTSTVRFYETIVDIDIHLGEFEGIVFALDADGDYRFREVLEEAKDAIPQSVGLDTE